MRPPICGVCDKDLEGDEGGLIFFAKSPSDLEWDRRAEDPHFVGHPPYAEWFCGEHYAKAKAFCHLTLSDAMKKVE